MILLGGIVVVEYLNNWMTCDVVGLWCLDVGSLLLLSM